MDDLIDEDLFWLAWPVWVIAPEGRVPAADAPAAFAFQGDRLRGVALFTDRGLADRFAAGLGQAHAAAAFPTRADFAAFLRAAQARGETHVFFNPGGQARHIPIQALLNAAGRGVQP